MFIACIICTESINADQDIAGLSKYPQISIKI
jgi:hypothetical protein